MRTKRPFFRINFLYQNIPALPEGMFCSLLVKRQLNENLNHPMIFDQCDVLHRKSPRGNYRLASEVVGGSFLGYAASIRRSTIPLYQRGGPDGSRGRGVSMPVTAVLFACRIFHTVSEDRG